jgi:deoxyribose-phosphate aldolase
MNLENLAPIIDHTLLKPEATETEVRRLVEEACQYGFASVCVSPNRVALARSIMESTSVGLSARPKPKVCTVLGFPLGNQVTRVKALEAQLAVEDGAQELDMVIALGALKDGQWEFVTKDIRAVVAEGHGSIVKVILETCLLSSEEIERASRAVVEAGADFVKTSTGFSQGGATAKDVSLMRQVVGPDFGVKASGGIRSYADAVAMVNAGANRLGTSQGVAIVTGAPKNDGGY